MINQKTYHQIDNNFMIGGFCKEYFLDQYCYLFNLTIGNIKYRYFGVGFYEQGITLS